MMVKRLRRLFLAMIICGAAGSCAGKTEDMPTLSLNIEVEEEANSAFISALRTFAMENSFKMAVDEPPTLPFTSFQMVRKDLEILGSNPFKRSQYEVSFYKVRGAQGASKETINQLAAELSRSVKTVQGVDVAPAVQAPASEGDS